MNTSRRRSLKTVIAAGFLLFLTGCNVGSTRFTLPDADPLTPNDVRFNEQWNLRTIQMPEAWGLLHDPLVQRIANNRQGLAPVVVAVLDTEIDVNHPDLAANVLGEAYDATTATNGGVEASSSLDHGTHVAGIIGARTDNATSGTDSIAGIGWNRIRILPVTVLEANGSGSVSSLIEGLAFASGMSSAQPLQRADVINLSLGSPGGLDPDLETLLNDIRESGILVVAAAGNGSSAISCALVESPARYASVMAVGSANGPDLSTFEHASYTACGPEVDLVAPGGTGTSADTYAGILSAIFGSGAFGFQAGTSQAAPHVAGVAALMRAVNQSLTPQQIRHILRETAASAPTTANPDRYGAGMLNAHAALAAALSQPYGPFAQNGFSVSSVGEGTDDPDSLGLRMSTGGNHTEPGRGARRFADEGPRGDELPRIIITLDRPWFRSTDHAAVEAELHDIAARHGLGPLRFLGNRFPSFEVTDAQTGSAELLLELVNELHIHDAIYDTPLQLTGHRSGSTR
ncbi:MAG: hypothetical protein EA383_17520 [Spirochaetaceae bacterium]|nr:MAG: hypothetical protein EA383_17520 [Spirochaetaceae bacterium]